MAAWTSGKRAVAPVRCPPSFDLAPPLELLIELQILLSRRPQGLKFPLPAGLGGLLRNLGELVCRLHEIVQIGHGLLPSCPRPTVRPGTGNVETASAMIAPSCWAATLVVARPQRWGWAPSWMRSRN